MIFNEIKCHVNTSLGLVGDASPASSPFPRLAIAYILLFFSRENLPFSGYFLLHVQTSLYFQTSMNMQKLNYCW